LFFKRREVRDDQTVVRESGHRHVKAGQSRHFFLERGEGESGDFQGLGGRTIG
jgi:hypothetical protein